LLALAGAGVLLCCLCVFCCVGGHRVLYHRTCWGRTQVPSDEPLSKRQRRRPEARHEYEGPNPLPEAYRDEADVQPEDQDDEEEAAPPRALPGELSPTRQGSSTAFLGPLDTSSSSWQDVPSARRAVPPGSDASDGDLP